MASAGWFCRKNGTSEPSAAASSFNFAGGKRLVEQFVQREQGGRGVAAAAAEAGGQRNFFLQMDSDAVADFCRLQKRRRPRDGQDSANRSADSRRLQESSIPLPPRSNVSSIAHVDRVHDGFEFVKAVGRLPRMFSSRLTLQGDFFSRRIGLHKNKTRQRQAVGALMQNDFGHGQIVEHLEPAAGNERRNVAAAEADVGVRVKQRVGNQAGL